jgi:hypothetical protein
MPPVVADLLREAGRNLMQMPLQRVRQLGHSVQMLGLLGSLLKEDKEEVAALRQAVKDGGNQSMEC